MLMKPLGSCHEVWVMPVLPFLKLYGHIFLPGELNIWKFSFCNCQMFFCYLWGQILFISFVCMLSTHIHPASRRAAKQRTLFFFYFHPSSPFECRPKWKISSQRSNSSQHCDASEEGVVMTYTWGGAKCSSVSSRGGKRWSTSHLQLSHTSTTAQPFSFISHPSSEEDESIHSLPGILWKEHVRSHCVRSVSVYNRKYKDGSMKYML